MPKVTLKASTLSTVRAIVANLALKGSSPADVAEYLGNAYPVPCIKAIFAEEFTRGAAICRMKVEQKMYDVIAETGDPKLIQFVLSRTGGKKWSEGGETPAGSEPKRLAIK
jgi:hypothetical protein